MSAAQAKNHKIILYTNRIKKYRNTIFLLIAHVVTAFYHRPYNIKIDISNCLRITTVSIVFRGDEHYDENQKIQQ